MTEIHTLHELSGITLGQALFYVGSLVLVSLIVAFVKNIPSIFTRNASKQYVDDKILPIKEKITDLKQLKGDMYLQEQEIKKIKSKMELSYEPEFESIGEFMKEQKKVVGIIYKIAAKMDININ